MDAVSQQVITAPPSRLLTVHGLLATYPGLGSRWKVYRLAAARRIPHVRVGDRLMFRQESIERWIDSLEVSAGTLVR